MNLNTLFRAHDKTHFITPLNQPNDGRIQVGSLWSNNDDDGLYICTGIGPVVFQLLVGGSGAPTTSSYLTLATDGGLDNERVLTAGTGISFADGGAGSTLTINADGAAAALTFSRTFLLMGS